MKKLMCVMFVLAVVPAFATVPIGPAMIVSGHFACTSKEWYREAAQYVVAGDRQSFKMMFDGQRCVVLGDPVKVHVVDYGIGFTVFSLQGTRLWIADEGLTAL